MPIAKIGTVLFILCFFFVLFYQVTCPNLPSKKSPILFYSNQAGDDLKRVILFAIQNAKHSIFLQIYGCTDEHVISSLCEAQKKGVKTEVFYDPSGSCNLSKKIPGAIPLIRSGLMHKKIVIIDNEIVFIGTANFTPTSLCMHDNVIVGMHSKDLSTAIQYSLTHEYQTEIQGQKISLWHLPDFQNQCLNTILDLLAQAKNTIHVSLFTFTHPKILEALFSAQERGVKVFVALDYYTASGASKKTVEILRQHSIPLYISQGGKLLHHKWCLIDEGTLLIGSANWTKSAFTINEDCLLVIHGLTIPQKECFKKIWKNLQSYSIKETT